MPGGAVWSRIWLSRKLITVKSSRDFRFLLCYRGKPILWFASGWCDLFRSTGAGLSKGPEGETAGWDEKRRHFLGLGVKIIRGFSDFIGWFSRWNSVTWNSYKLESHCWLGVFFFCEEQVSSTDDIFNAWRTYDRQQNRGKVHLTLFDRTYYSSRATIFLDLIFYWSYLLISDWP